MQKILLLAGDFTEDYETMVPFQALSMLGFQVDAVCPGKKEGELIKTAVHDFEGDQTYTEKPGHLFKLTKTFDEVTFDDYAGLFITGGRAPEYIRTDSKVIELVKCFMKSDRPVAAICHGAQVLTAADVLRGRTLTCYPAVAPDVKLAGGNYVEVAPEESVVDGNLITAPAWPGNITILRDFAKALGCEIVHRPQAQQTKVFYNNTPVQEEESMASILEQLHKMHIQNAVDELTEKGGNENVEDHPLDGVYRCKVCGYIFDEAKEGRPFTTISHCPVCNVGQQQFERIN